MDSSSPIRVLVITADDEWDPADENAAELWEYERMLEVWSTHTNYYRTKLKRALEQYQAEWRAKEVSGGWIINSISLLS